MYVAYAFVVVYRHTVSTLLHHSYLLVAVAVHVLRLPVVLVKVSVVVRRLQTLLICDQEVHAFAHLVAASWHQSLLTLSEHLYFVVLDQLASGRLVNIIACGVCEVHIQITLV